MSSDPVLSPDAPDHQLVGRVLGGESEAFRALIHRHAGAVNAVMRANQVEAATADDLVQDVFAQAFERLAQLRDPTRFGPWLGEIARNRCRRHLAAEARRPEVGALPIEDVASQPPVASSGNDVVSSALARLPEEFREVLVLRHVEGRSLAEIAEVLGLGANGVNARLYRARVMMRRLMKGGAQ